MTLETFIAKMLDSGADYQETFGKIIEAVESTREVLSDEIETGEVDRHALIAIKIAMITAIYKGFDVAFDNYMDSLEK